MEVAKKVLSQMDYLQLCAYRQQCGDFVHCSQQPICLRSVRTVKSTLFTHSCRILISPLCTCHRLCHAIQSDLLSVWNMQGKSSGKLFYLYETVYFFFLSFIYRFPEDNPAEVLLLWLLH